MEERKSNDLMGTNTKSLVFVFLVLLSLLVLYTAYDKQTKTLNEQKAIDVLMFVDSVKSLSELNKIAALASIGLIAVVFLVGPLSKFFPKLFGKYLVYRKPVGLSGLALGLIHGIYSAAVFYNFSLDNVISAGKELPIAASIIGLGIFIIMGITSTKKAVEYFGYKNWKTIQTCGYIGLLLIILHFFLLESKPVIGLDVRPYGLVFFYLAIIAIIMRLVLIIVETKDRKKYEQHFGQTGKQT
ncbi:ferric reductase-like transmembrane domain-containing protein [Candidatus Micrarchaeota archaeon]|nr:ferric reductase-like transmembrane domain-containing protein [Candidatus Micrarchaeota archaeon]